MGGATIIDLQPGCSVMWHVQRPLGNQCTPPPCVCTHTVASCSLCAVSSDASAVQAVIFWLIYGFSSSLRVTKYVRLVLDFIYGWYIYCKLGFSWKWLIEEPVFGIMIMLFTQWNTARAAKTAKLHNVAKEKRFHKTERLLSKVIMYFELNANTTTAAYSQWPCWCLYMLLKH